MAKKSNYITKLLIKKLASGLEAKGITVKALILFGSHARGTAKPHSDIDIAVISPGFRKYGILRRQELLGEVIYPLGQPIEALGYTPEEYKNPPKYSFLSEIIANGKIVFAQ